MRYRLLAFIIVLLLPILYMEMDEYFSGDEVVTYNMANNAEAGFVFSDGRVSNYLKNEVFTDDSNVVSKLIEVASDLIKRRGAASILTYPRETEVRLYSQDEIRDWFSKNSNERFNVLTTWLHSVSDDGNSWLYYSLVNISSSVFMNISASKWSGFIVNIIFHFLTILMLIKLGKRIGNSELHIAAMLIFYGCAADIVTTTVTNLRAYTVAAFFTTLLVWQILNIHESLFKKNRIDAKNAALIVLFYAVGYVSHYTVGAVLASFGAILLFFMFLGKIRGSIKILLLGIISIIIGFMLSPDSIIGILKKFMVSGAGAAITGEGSSFSVGIILLTVISLILLVICIIAAVRKKDLINDERFFMTCSSLLMLVIILLGTKGFGYMRVLFPVIYLTVFQWIIVLTGKVAGSVSSRKLRTVSVLLLAIYVIVNSKMAYDKKADENMEFLAKQEALDTVKADTCVYFRKHARGYADTRCLLDRFDKVQVITVDTENWESFVEYKPGGEDFVCFFTDGCEEENAIKWIESLGYSNGTELYGDEDAHIFVAKNH